MPHKNWKKVDRPRVKFFESISQLALLEIFCVILKIWFHQLQVLKLGKPPQDTPGRTPSVYNRKNGRPDSKINSNEKKSRKLNLSMKLFGKKFRKSRIPKIWTEGQFGARQKFSNCNCAVVHCECELLRMILEHNRLTL